MDINLTNPQQLIPLLQKHHLYTQKSLGQHFLIDHSVIEAAIQAADIQPTDIIIEVGTGTGVLTRELAQHAAKVITFEIDTKLQPLLTETLANFSNIEIHFQDFLKVNFEEVLQGQAVAGISARKDQNSRATPGVTSPEKLPEGSENPPYKFVANLPYNVGSHIIDLLVKSKNPPQSITVLLQKEVAQKFVAQPPHATYLSNFIQTYGQASLIQIVPPASFFPPPKVDSALMNVLGSQFTIHSNAPTNRQVATDNRHQTAKSFSQFLHRGFAQPRKMLNKSFSKDQLAQANIDPSLRPENLSFSDWLQLYQALKN